MSDHTNLNPDLNELERVLRGIAIPSNGINREELMYRSGWEAALASSTRSAQLSSPRESAAFGWLLPSISVLSSAAAILFGVMLFAQSWSQDEAEQAVAGRIAPAVEVSAESNSPAQAEDSNAVVAAVPDLLQRVMDFPVSKTLYAGMIVGREFPADSETGFESPVSPSSRNLPTPMTQQQLLDELLPNRFDRSPKWSLFRSGSNS